MSGTAVPVRASLTHREKWWSALGGACGIAATLAVGLWTIEGPPSLALIA